MTVDVGDPSEVQEKSSGRRNGKTECWRVIQVGIIQYLKLATSCYSPLGELPSFSVCRLLFLSSHSCGFSLPCLVIKIVFPSPLSLYLFLWPQASLGPQMASVAKKGCWLVDESIPGTGNGIGKNCCVRPNALRVRKRLLWLPVNSPVSVKLNHGAHQASQLLVLWQLS